MTRRRRRPALALLAAAIVSLVMVPGIASGAGETALTVRADSPAADGQADIRVRAATNPGVRCSADLTHRGFARSQLLAPIVTSNTGQASWLAHIARGVRAGQWTATVTCTFKDRTVNQAAVFSTPHRGPPGPPGTPLVVSIVRRSPESNAAKGGRGGTGQLEPADLDDPYPPGECTWWAWFERPDLPYFGDGAKGDALNWLSAAKADGLSVGRTPRPHAIAVFAPRQPAAAPPRARAGQYGHVAYVIGVAGPRIEISEAHFQGFPPGHHRSIPWRGLGFIYPPAGPPAPKVRPGRAPIATPDPAGGKSFAYTVYHTCANGSCGLPEHQAARLSAPTIGRPLPDGTPVRIRCQTRGDRVTGVDASSSNVWDQLSDGDYVADFYINTPGSQQRPQTDPNGELSPPIPDCGAVPPDNVPKTPPEHLVPSRTAPDVAYDCPAVGRASNQQLVPVGGHASQPFIATAASLRNGTILIDDATGQRGTRTTTIAIYDNATASGTPLGQASVLIDSMTGTDPFIFTQPVATTAGQPLWLTVTADGGAVHVYNQRSPSGCLVAELDSGNPGTGPRTQQIEYDCPSVSGSDIQLDLAQGQIATTALYASGQAVVGGEIMLSGSSTTPVAVTVGLYTDAAGGDTPLAQTQISVLGGENAVAFSFGLPPTPTSGTTLYLGVRAVDGGLQAFAQNTPTQCLLGEIDYS